MPADGSEGTSREAEVAHTHAIELAETLVDQARQQGRSPRSHLFISAPNGFTFFLGQFTNLTSMAFGRALTVLV
jgi:hypothetical protein